MSRQQRKKNKSRTPELRPQPYAERICGVERSERERARGEEIRIECAKKKKKKKKCYLPS
ncbi:predicted protein [Plenodomus lingam JN3]|uniref:Predicted protein n=1 Tax=Leptosphaeria maculans (strain JN3 / isolate v23.1.3 / race Av1-4-5-6-7-8) TaxID=985895 RepID=E4ZS57_LEPMJ|nr:predicted protein [Plenodomus lingam JN3]CBX94237.1 predicted protein [Plenodomus lingam JN3]